MNTKYVNLIGPGMCFLGGAAIAWGGVHYDPLSAHPFIVMMFGMLLLICGMLIVTRRTEGLIWSLGDPFPIRAMLKVHGRMWVTTLYVDPRTRRFSAPQDPAERFLDPASVEDWENPEMVRVPHFKMENPTEFSAVTMLGHRFEFRKIKFGRMTMVS